MENNDFDYPDINEVDSEYHLSFNLTDRQKEISDKLDELVSDGKSVLLEAVCGAGKTELVYKSISNALASGKRVGFAIPRRQVVLEIADRLASVFTKLKVVRVAKGYTDDIFGDLVVATTHQLYRYNNYFDYLIIDEPDAFPFKGNAVLEGIAKNSCKGSIVYLSATPDKKLLDLVKMGKLEYLYLPKRPTGKDMIVPKTFYGIEIVLLVKAIIEIKKLIGDNKQVLLFIPTRKEGRNLFKLFKMMFNCCYIDSTSEDKDETLRKFKDKEYDLCLSTTVLERGITIKSINMIVYKANHPVYDEASLVQMAGRVGRSVIDPYGLCLFLATSKDSNIDNCIERIIDANNY